MKKLNTNSLLLAGIVIACGCTTLKRYNSAGEAATDNTLAGIDLFGFRLSDSKPGPGSKTLWDLSADAQSQFIKILNNRYPDNGKFLEAMSFEYMKDEEPAPSESYTNKDLRMVFSISRERDYGNHVHNSGIKPSPADRIEYVKITLSIPDDSPVFFTGWNMFTTEYGTVEIADVTFSRNLQVDMSGMLSTDRKEKGSELTAGVGSGTTRKEEQEIRYRYLKLNGKINSNEIVMEEEGTREIDLTGNITADIAMEFKKFPERITELEGLKDSSGRYSEPVKLIAGFSDVTIPAVVDVRDTLYAVLKMEYVLSNVVKGQRTFPEWDDRVRYYTGSVSRTIPLFSSRDYVPDFYCIGTSNLTDGQNIIRMHATAENEYALIFRSGKDATAFYLWLDDYYSRAENRQRPVTIGGYRLRFMDEDLTGEIYARHPDMGIVPRYR